MSSEPEYCWIDEIEDPRLAVYRDLKKSNATRNSEFFIAEGRLVVERLLAAGQWEVESVLVSAERLSRIEGKLRPGSRVYVVSHANCSRLVGFNFHAGLLACGRRQRRLKVEIPGQIGEVAEPASAVARETEAGPGGVRPETLIACPQVSMPDNLGSIIRLAAAFGMSGVIVGPMSADAWSRRVVRVSMGNIFGVPIFEPDDFEGELRRLSEQEQYEVVGASRSPRAEPLRSFQPTPRMVLVLGNEATGLRPEWERLCRREVEIEMSREVDSLNVSTAAGILMYAFSDRGW